MFSHCLETLGGKGLSTEEEFSTMDSDGSNWWSHPHQYYSAQLGSLINREHSPVMSIQAVQLQGRGGMRLRLDPSWFERKP